jgi:hypothetical protein
MHTVLAAILASGLTVGLERAMHAAAFALGRGVSGIGGTAVFLGHTAIVAIAACAGLLLALRVLPRALPTAAALGVMLAAVAAIVAALFASGGRVGIELGVWLYDLMPMAFGLFFARAIARDRLRAEVDESL